MKIGINLAAELLYQNIDKAIRASNCPAVIVMAVLERQMAQARARMEAAVENENQMWQQAIKEEEDAAAAAAQAAAAEQPMTGREGEKNGG